MKLVTAIIKPFKLESVMDALKAVGVSGMTITEVKGFGRQSGHTVTYRGAEYRVDFIPKVKIEAIVEDAQVDPIMAAIRDSGSTGKIGDGKVWVLDIDALMRVRTGEVGVEAI